jgi:hypothetical protein
MPSQTLNPADYGLLDNPIWNALTTSHAHLALGASTAQARRYPIEIGPLSGLREPTTEAFAELAAIIPDGDIAILFLEEIPQLPSGWQLLRGGTLVQMLCPTIPDAVPTAEVIAPLEDADYAEMLALATLTEPGPFRSHTAALGGFLGIRVEGRLAAMAGRRLAPGAFVEHGSHQRLQATRVSPPSHS